MDTYHAAHWSDISYSSSEEEDERYRYDDCVDPLVKYLHTIVCTDERGTFRHLEIAPKDEPDL